MFWMCGICHLQGLWKYPAICPCRATFSVIFYVEFGKHFVDLLLTVFPCFSMTSPATLGFPCFSLLFCGWFAFCAFCACSALLCLFIFSWLFKCLIFLTFPAPKPRLVWSSWLFSSTFWSFLVFLWRIDPVCCNVFFFLRSVLLSLLIGWFSILEILLLYACFFCLCMPFPLFVFCSTSGCVLVHLNEQPKCIM